MENLSEIMLQLDRNVEVDFDDDDGVRGGGW